MFFQSTITNGPIGTRAGWERANVARWLSTLGLNYENLIGVEQIHGAAVAVVGPEHRGQIIKSVDALVTKTPGLILGIRTADCFPVSFSDQIAGICAVAHAGWRGIVAGVIENTVQAMIKNGATVANIAVNIGAGIQVCHFEVKDDVAVQFTESLENRQDKKFVNLKKEILRHLVSQGINKNNVLADARCTVCDLNLFSHRRDHYTHGEMLSVSSF